MKKPLATMNYLIALSALFLATASRAQQTPDTTLVRTVVVEQEYTPDIMDATKVNVLPQVTPPSAPRQKVAYDATLHPANHIPATSMPSYAAQETHAKAAPAYVRLGYGSLGQVDAQAACHLLLPAENRLSLSLTLDGYQDKLNLPDYDGEKWSSYHYRTQAALDFVHRFRQTELHAGGSFSLRNFNQLPISANTKQKLTSGDVQLGVRSLEESVHPLGFRADLGLLFYGRQHDLFVENSREAHVRLQGEAWGALSETQRIHLGLQASHYLYKEQPFEDVTTLTLNPAYCLQNDAWNLRLGVKSDLAFGFGKKMQAAPDVTASYTFSESYVLTAQATGGRLQNDFRRIETLCPYVESATQYDATYEQVNASLGLKGSPTAGFRFHLYGGYQQLKHDLVVTGRPSASSVYPIMLPSFEVDDTHNIYGGADVSYSYKAYIGLYLSGLYRSWEWDNASSYGTPFKPELELKARVDLSPMRMLRLSVGYNHTTYTGDAYEAGNDLYLQGRYELESVWEGLGVWVEAHNLLDKKQVRYPGVPALGIRFMGGASLRF